MRETETVAGGNACQKAKCVMESEDDRDRLMETLLKKVAGAAPRSRSKVILARAAMLKAAENSQGSKRPSPLKRLSRWLPFAAAASIVGAAGYFFLAPLMFGDRLHGMRIVTEALPATQDLDGYCHIDLEPQGSIVIDGERKARKILLEHGSVTCFVEKHVGTFAVACELGTVAVHGTKFKVSLTGDGARTGEAADGGRQLSVHLLDGTVALTSSWNASAILAEDKDAPREGGVLSGILTDKGIDENGEAWFSVIADDETEAVKYHARHLDSRIDADMQTSLKRFYLRNRVRLLWTKTDLRRIAAIEMIDQKQRSGSISGLVVRINENWIDVKPAGGPIDRYTVGGENHINKEGRAKLQTIRLSEQVTVDWSFNLGCKRIDNISKTLK